MLSYATVPWPLLPTYLIWCQVAVGNIAFLTMISLGLFR